MSREGFVAPTQLSQAASGFSSTKSNTVKYICTNCATSLSLGRNDAIRCSACGHRVLYKSRTRRMVQFEAR
ncbi:hypothetical protein WICANDRAFT_28915 [Wickerhamomyces anomalus NRRL Y-366-8]|uniref:Uncharacterized protein n=1 Tax=Wickerhamomyces anomalus (strain ATCC 58044 / CBS 1984 / NCYC 433 / NRRL Y-366-8) TaxID=683960 RepID=A0A1E3P8G6_WICAA|nr:uncharacterized protein WICANDRAFT_28915 [Wickerhamomyces anomalus NRRL Y-366-8]ODQ61242.1 hypothetical protein WICANDRAFT_28915 [Wickerhamomyces anomalus NRRL Y-366-8]